MTVALIAIGGVLLIACLFSRFLVASQEESREFDPQGDLD